MAVNNKLIYENQCGNVGIGTDVPNAPLDISKTQTLGYSETTDQRNSARLIVRNSDETAENFSGISFVTGGSNQAEWSINSIYKSAYNGDLAFKTRSGGSSWSERMRIKNDGNVLLGDTSTFPPVPASNEGIFLYAAGSIKVINNTTNGSSAFYGTASSTNVNAASAAGHSLNLFNLDSTDGNLGGHLRFGKADSLSTSYIGGVNVSHTNRDGALVFGTSDGAAPVERMRIDKTGNVGIGTPSPAIRTHIRESTLSGFTPDSNTNLAVEENSTSLIEIAGTDSGILFSDASAWAGRIFYTHSTDQMAFATAQTNKMFLTSAGNLGIGTAPEHTLHVKDAADNAVVEVETSATNGNPAFRLKNDAREWQWQLRGAESDSLVAWDVTGGAGRLYLTTSGRLAIGHSNPAATLHVEYQASTPLAIFDEMLLTSTNSSQGAFGSQRWGWYGTAWSRNASSCAAGWGSGFTGGDGDFGVHTVNDACAQNTDMNSTNLRFVVKNDGNVGIGTSSPDYDLHVQDDVEANIKIETNNDGASNFAGLRMFKSRGSNASPTSVANGDIISQIAMYARDGSDWNNTARILTKICGTVTSTDTPTDLIFSTGTTNINDRLIIKSGGTVCAAGIMCANTCFHSQIVCGSTYLASPYSSVSCAYSSVCLRTDGVFCIKGDDILFCEAAVNKDRFITIGPNSSWCGCLIVGSGQYPGDAVTRAHITVSNGNLHIDSANSCLGNANFLYLQHHAGCATIFGNGDCAQIGCIGCAGNLCTNSCVHSPVLCAGTRVNVGGSACIETGWLRNVNNNTGLYNVANALHWYTCLACEWKIQTSAAASQINMGVCKDATATCITAGYVYANNSCEIMFLNNSHVRVLAACPNCHAATACTHCANISCGTTCSISPIVCGSSCVKGAITCGATCVISPIICGAGCTVADGELRVDRICGLNINGDSGQQVTGAGGGSVYQWGYQAGGAWASPFPDLVIGFHTGLIFGANCNYGGTRFYSDHPHNSTAQIIFLVGCGNCNVCACYNLCAAAGVYSPIICATTTMQVGGNDVLTTASSVGANFCAGTDVNNRVVTANGASGSLCGEANMTFDGSTLNVTGAITASGDITSTSDERVKSDINSIDCAIFIVNGLCGRRYIKDNKKQIGIIAQEAENILPEIVFEGNDENKMKSVSYGNITAVLIEAIKEQQKEINVLRKELDFLKSSKEE